MGHYGRCYYGYVGEILVLLIFIGLQIIAPMLLLPVVLLARHANNYGINSSNTINISINIINNY